MEPKDRCDVKLRSFLCLAKRGGHGGTWSINHPPQHNVQSLPNIAGMSRESSSEIFDMPFISNVRAPPSGTKIMIVE